MMLTDRIVTGGACIGCGLCEAVSEGAIRMTFTLEMRERPLVVDSLSSSALKAIETSCPGLIAEGISADEAGDDAISDPMWGLWRNARLAWAGDPDIRHRSSSGGVLSALSAYLLETGEVDFVLHSGPDPERPARSTWKISHTPEEAADSGGSRYGPTAPLAGLAEAQRLVRDGFERFAFVGKPCDVSAIRLLARQQDWLRRSLAYRLTLMCGGESEFTKTADLLNDWDIVESDLTEFRYRGLGNPGPTTARTRDGRTFQISYQALWEDESRWDLQHRCKICADAIGMAADLVAFDCWPGGGPSGEDEGFNAVLTRTPKGDDLFERAVRNGALEAGRHLDASDFESFQPHQSRKRLAVWARLIGQRAAGKCTPESRQLQIRDLARRNDCKTNLAQARGTRFRLRQGRGTEPRPSGLLKKI